jgi:hypothetical protein
MLSPYNNASVVGRYRNKYRDSCGMHIRSSSSIATLRTLYETPAIHVKVSNHDVRSGVDRMASENWCSVAMIAHKAKGAIMQTNPVKGGSC